MNPEEEAEIILWDWLKTKGESVLEIYFNRKNKLNWNIFSVTGVQKKPDFLMCVDNGYGKRYIVIEVKSSEKSKDILDAQKIIDYWELYITGQTKYFVENKEVKIDCFLIATDKSKNGYLFKNEDVKDNLLDDSRSKKYAVGIGIIPRYEGHRTFEFIRTLWNNYGKKRKQYAEKCGLGILIADIEDNLLPKMMITYYYQTKSRWSQRWWRI